MTVIPPRVRLVLAREWVLYAFPVGVTPTDERGLALGAEEIGQLVESATKDLFDDLVDTKAALAAAHEELEPLRDQVATLLRDKALADSKRK